MHREISLLSPQRSRPSRFRLACESIIQSLEVRLMFSGATTTISTPTPAPGASNVAVIVEFADASPINLATIGVKNLTVNGAANGSLTVTGDSIDASNPEDVFATYYVNAPNLIWDQRANDTYTIALQANQVFDSQGAAAAAASAQMIVQLQPIVGPLAAASDPSFAQIDAAGTTAEQLEVTYSDPVGVDVASIGPQNLVSYFSSLNVKLVSVASQDNGQVVHAVYQLTAPNGAFFPADNTTYHIALAQPGQGAVLNTSGQAFTAGQLGLYSVTIDPESATSPFANTTSDAFVSEASARQSSGKLVVAGHIGDTTAGQSQIELERLNADGSLDTTFGNDGVFVGPAGDNEAAFAMTVLPNDQILIAGTSAGNFMLERFNSTGTVDTSFGPNGTGEVTTNLGSDLTSEIANTLAIAPDGTIVTAGGADGDWAFARYSANGSPLNSFTLALPDGQDGTVGGLAISSGGLIVAAGADGTAVDLAAFDSNGSLDSAFNHGVVLALPGMAVRDDLGYIDHNVGLAIAGSNYIVAATTPDDPGEFAVERVTNSGAADASFGPNQTGLVTTAFSGDADAQSVVPQSNGTIVVNGINTDATGAHLVSVTYNSNGTIFVSTPPSGSGEGSISGAAFNGQTGLPLGNVTIELNAGQATTTTDSNGQYAFSNLSAGTYDITEVSPAGLAPEVATANVNVSGNGDVAGPTFANLPDTPASPTAPDLTATFATSPPSAVVSGAKGQLTLHITNIGNAKASGTIKIALFASSTNTLTAGASAFTTVPAHINLKPGGSDNVHLKFNYPAGMTNGSYFILAAVDSTNVIAESNESNNVAASSSVMINAPTVALAGSITAPASIVAGKRAVVPLLLNNTGDILAAGSISVGLFTSDDQALDDGDTLFATVPLHIHIKPNADGHYQLHFKLAAGLVTGEKFVIAKIDAGKIKGISASAITIAAATQTEFS